MYVCGCLLAFVRMNCCVNVCAVVRMYLCVCAFECLHVVVWLVDCSLCVCLCISVLACVLVCVGVWVCLRVCWFGCLRECANMLACCVVLCV